jgi:hypothetical protein
VAAADGLAAAGYRPGAAQLVRRLGGPLEAPRPGPGWEGWNPWHAVLRALAVVGGDAEVPAVAALLDPRHADAAVRREALATLAAMRSAAADQAVRSFLAQPVAERVAWNPPLPAAGSPRLRVPLPDGRQLAIFQHGYLGDPSDLWVAQLGDGDKILAPALFTGQILPAGQDLAGLAARIATVAGDAADLRIELRNRQGSLCAAFSLAAIARDTDGDGLTDLVEARLRLDPANPDSDGDGVTDAQDPAPNARLREPITQDQEIAATLFNQFFRFAADDPATPPEIAVVVSEFALKWRGRRQTTITLDAREAERFLDETAGASGVALVTLRHGEPDAVATVSGDPPGQQPTPSAADEEVYTLTVAHGSVHRQIYRAFLRNLDAARRAGRACWVLSSLRLVDLR